MTTFVDTSVLLGDEQAVRDQDPVVVVVRSAQGMLREGLGETDSALFEKNFASAYAESNWAGVIDLLLGSSAVVFKKVSSADDVERVSKTAEGYFEVTLSLLSKLETVEDVTSRIDSFVSTMQAEASDAPSVLSLKLKLLTTLFSTLNPRAQLRLQVARGLCRFGASDSAKFAFAVFALVKECDTWISEFNWELTEEDKAEIFGLVASVAPAADKLKFLSLQASVASATERPALLTQLAIATIRDPTTESYSVSESTPAGQCLSILSMGTFTEMEAFVGKNESFLAENKIEKSQLLDKMRMLALARLSENVKTVDIKRIGQELRSENPVEWIIKTIRSGLIVGSIDEVAGVLRLVAVKTAASKTAVESDLQKILARISGI